MSDRAPTDPSAPSAGPGAARLRTPAEGRPLPWGIAIRDVVVASILVVGAVLGAVVLTSVLPVEGQRIVFHTPLAIVVLVAVTGWILWRAAGRRPPGS